MRCLFVAIVAAALVNCLGAVAKADKPKAGHTDRTTRHSGDRKSHATHQNSHGTYQKSHTTHLNSHGTYQKSHGTHQKSHHTHQKSHTATSHRKPFPKWTDRPNRTWYPYNYSRAYRSVKYYGPVEYGFGPYQDLFPYHPYPPYIVRPRWYSPYYYNGPLYMPAERIYGPQAVKRFMGLDQPNVVVPKRNDADRDREEEQDRRKIERREQRATNRESVALGLRFIEFGDARFANQQYRGAYQSYRRAAQAAPRLADAYFRQCYALTCMGSYSTAITALRRGLLIDPDWSRSEFDPAELYGENRIAKEAHFEAMKKAAAEKPRDANLAVLLGVVLYFDGKIDQAGAEFRRASKLLRGQDAEFMKGFLDGTD